MTELSEFSPDSFMAYDPPAQTQDFNPDTFMAKQPKPKEDMEATLRRMASEEGIADPSHLLSIGMQESGDNPNVATSGANAQGGMQVKPSTGLHFVTPEEWATPEGKIRAGVRYYKSLHEKYGNADQAIAGYFTGEPNVDRAIAQGKTIPDTYDPISKISTPQYVQSVKKRARRYQAPELQEFDPDSFMSGAAQPTTPNPEEFDPDAFMKQSAAVPAANPTAMTPDELAASEPWRQPAIDPKFGGVIGQSQSYAPQPSAWQHGRELGRQIQQQPQSPFNAQHRPGTTPSPAYAKALQNANAQIQNWQQEYNELANSDDNSLGNQQNMQALKGKIDAGAEALVARPESFQTIGERDQQRQQQQHDQHNAMLSARKSAFADAVMAPPENRMEAYKKLASYGPLSDKERQALGVSQSDWKSYLDSFVTGAAEFGAKAEGAVGRAMSGVPMSGIGEAITQNSESNLANIRAYENIYNKENTGGHVLHQGGELLPQAAGAIALAPETLALKLAYWSGSTAALGYGAGEEPEQYLKEGALAIPAVLGAEGFAALGEGIAPEIAKMLGNTPAALTIEKQIPRMVSVIGNVPANGLITRMAGGDEQATTSSMVLAGILSAMSGGRIRTASTEEIGRAAIENLRTADETAGNTRFQDLTEKVAGISTRTGAPEDQAIHEGAAIVDKARRGGEGAIQDLENMFRDIGELPPAPAEPTATSAEPVPPAAPPTEPAPTESPKQLTGNKALYEMTAKEAADRNSGLAAPVDPELLTKLHENSIQEAIARGETVRPEVLDDFPQLKPAENVADERSGLDRRQTEGEAPQGVERRTGPRRLKIAEMNVEEARTAAGQSRKTGLQNYEVFQDDEEGMAKSHPHVGYADLDDFKKMNSIFTEDGVDAGVLPIVGQVIRDAVASEPAGSIKPYHRSGDEFLFRSDDPARISRVVQRANEILDNTVFTYTTPDGEVINKKGVMFSHGTGSNEYEAIRAGKADKQRRKDLGLRIGDRDTEALAGPGATGKQTDKGDDTGRESVSSQTEGEIVGFTTSQGSTYTIDGESTQRTKSLHAQHDPKDVGLKPASERTVYVDPEHATEIGMHLGLSKEGKPRVFIDGDKIALTHKYGKEPDGRTFTKTARKEFPYSTTPEVGKAPVEFLPRGSVHPGNSITEIHYGGKSNAVKPGEIETGVSTEHERAEQRPAPSGNIPKVRGEKGAANRRGDQLQGAAQAGKPEVARLKTYEEAQKAIDDREDELETQGIDPIKLSDSTWPKDLPLIEGYQKMPPDLEELYRQRDEIGAKELKSNIDGISRHLRQSGIADADIPDVLDSISLHPDKTDALAQYSAAEHTLRRALGDPKKLAEDIFIKLAAKRGLDIQFSRTSDDIIHPDRQTLADARNAVIGIRRYFGDINEEGQNQGIKPDIAENFKPLETEVAKPDSVLGQHIDAAIDNPTRDNQSKLHDAAVSELAHIEDPDIWEQHAAAIVDAAIGESKAGGVEERTGKTEPKVKQESVDTVDKVRASKIMGFASADESEYKLIHPSAKQPGKWQITFFHGGTSAGTTGDTQVADVDLPAALDKLKADGYTRELPVDRTRELLRRSFKLPETKPNAPAKKKSAEETKSLSQFVRARGGLRADADLGGEINRLRSKESGTTGLFTKNGLSPDGMLEAAIESHYLPADATISDLITAVEKDAGGKKVYSTARDQNIIDKELDREYERLQASKDSSEAFKRESEIVETELADPESELGLAFDAAVDDGDSELRKTAEQFGITPETIANLVRRANDIKENGVETADFQESGGEERDATPEEFQADIDRTEAAGKLETEKNAAKAKAENDKELLRIGMKSGRANVVEKKTVAPKDTKTPDMFDEQQGLFGGSQAGQVNPKLLNVMTAGVGKFITDDFGRAASVVAQETKMAIGSLRRLYAPQTVNRTAKLTALSMREHRAQMERDVAKTDKALESLRKFFNGRSNQDNLDFIDAVERNQIPVNDSAITEAARTFRDILDTERDAVRALGTGKLQHFIENYFPHFWEDPDKAANWIQMFTAQNRPQGKPIEGTKSFLKKRSLPTVADGIKVGLIPKSYNPVDFVFWKYAEMRKYRFANEFLQEQRGRGIVKYVPLGKKPEFYDAHSPANAFSPAGAIVKQGVTEAAANNLAAKGYTIEPTKMAPYGWDMVNDKVSTVYGRGDHGELITRGHYFMPRETADVINNYLSPGLRGRKDVVGVAFRGFNGLTNWINQFSLGLSAFHVFQTGLISTAAQFNQAIQELQAGHPIRSIGSLIKAPIAPFLNLRLGPQLRRQYFGQIDNPALEPAINALVKGGAAVGLDPTFKTEVTKHLREAWAQGNYPGAILRAVPATVEAINRLVMERWVPNMKLSAEWRRAQFELDRLGPGASNDQIREAMARVSDVGDDFFGQMKYDNLFFNKAVKDLTTAFIGRFGWQLGTVRGIGGAGLEVLGLPKRTYQYIRQIGAGGGGGKSGGPGGGKSGGGFADDKGPSRLPITDRQGYTIGLFVMAGLAGGIAMYLMTGKKPEELKDYFFPQTGRTDEQGNPERLSISGYIKDTYNWIHDPKQTFLNKVNPALKMLNEVATNRDYKSQPIVYPEDSAKEKVKAMAGHVGEQFIPLSIKNLKKERDRGHLGIESMVESQVMTPAPSSLNDTPATERMRELLAQRGISTAPATRAEAEQRQLKRDLVSQGRKGEDIGDKVALAYQAGKISKRQIGTINKAASESALQSRFLALPPADALSIFVILMNPAEQDKIVRFSVNDQSVLGKKRAAYVESLPDDLKESDEFLKTFDAAWDVVLKRNDKP